MKQKLKRIFTENKICFVVEAISFCLLIIFGFIWISNPNPLYERIITVVAFSFIGLEIYRRYSKKKTVLLLHIKTANTLICKYRTTKQTNENSFALILYDLVISNDSEVNCTVKEVKIEYIYQNQLKQSDSIVLITGSVYSPQIKSKVDSILIQKPTEGIVLMNWYNLRQVIAQNNILIAGGIMRGSCLFIIELDKKDDVKEISNLNLVITDYKGSQSKHLLNVQDACWQSYRSSYVEYDNSQINH